MKAICLIAAILLVTIAYSQETTTIYLIRHAEKADNSADPDLSEAGKQRAQKWGTYFSDRNIEIYYATAYKRALQTVTPISSSITQVTGTSVNKTIRNYEPQELSLKEVAETNKGKNILIVGHSNTIPAQINALLGKKVYNDIDEKEFSNLYIIKITKDKVTHEMVKI